MAFPPAALRIDQSNATPQQDQHPLDHRTTNQAVNDTVAAMKIASGYTQVTPVGNVDAAAAAFTNWIIAGVSLPVWTRLVHVTTTIAGLYQVNAADGSFELLTGLDVQPGDTVFHAPVGASSRSTVTYVDQFAPVRTGTVNVVVQAKRAFGSSALRVDTACRIRWAFRFYP